MTIRTRARALLLAAGLGAASLMGAVSAKAVTLNEIVQRGTVRIGVLIGGPPMGMVDDKGNPTGYDYDVAVLLAKYLGVKAEYVALTPPARIPALQTGRVDFLVATLNPTPERARSVMFTMPYNAFNMVVATTGGKTAASLDDLKGKKVGANRGSPQEAALRRAGGISVVVFDDDSIVTQALLSGQIDAAALPETVVQSVTKQNPDAKLAIGFSIYAQGNSIAVRQGDFELLQWLNNTVYFMKKNGELDTLYRKWTDTPLPPLDTF